VLFIGVIYDMRHEIFIPNVHTSPPPSTPSTELAGSIAYIIDIVSNRFSPPKTASRSAVGGKNEDNNLAAAPTYLALHAPLRLSPQNGKIRENFLSTLVEREKKPHDSKEFLFSVMLVVCKQNDERVKRVLGFPRRD
jgi:hypothetical protein